MEDHPTEDIPDDLERFDILDDVFDILCAPEQDGKMKQIPRATDFWTSVVLLTSTDRRVALSRTAAAPRCPNSWKTQGSHRVIVTPTLKLTLLDTVRKSIFKDGWPSITPSDALEIFEQN